MFRTLVLALFALFGLLLQPATHPAQAAGNGLNDGRLIASAGVTGEPVVGGVIAFNIGVTNSPNPGDGSDPTYFEDRLYNVSAEIVLPPGVELISCPGVSPDAVQSFTYLSQPYTRLLFDNIKNLEVDESITISCQARLTEDITIGTPFQIDYRWSSNTLPDQSGFSRCAPTTPCPQPSAYNPAQFLNISQDPQAFDLEKAVLTNTGQYQVNGAGSYSEGNNGVPVDWDYQYQLTITNNEINPSGSIVITDIVPPGVAYLGTDSIVCTAHPSPATIEPTLFLAAAGNTITLDGNTVTLDEGDLVLTWDFDALFGSAFELDPGANTTSPLITDAETCTITYNTAIAYRYRTSADDDPDPNGISQVPLPGNPFGTGAGQFDGAIIPHAAIHTNRYNAEGVYITPDPDPDVPSADGVYSTPQDDSPVSVASGYHSLAKNVSTSTVLQDTVLTYTVDGWISEYYDFEASPTNPYIITDVLPNGLDFCGYAAASDPDNDGDGVPDGYYGTLPDGACPAVVAAQLIDPVTSTVLATFNYPDSITQNANNDLVLQWNYIYTGGAPIGDPAHPLSASSRWQLRYTAVVRDFYEADPGDPILPVSGLDVRTNRVEADGKWYDRITSGREGQDVTNGGASISVQPPELDKRVWDQNANGGLGDFVDVDWDLDVGDVVRYRIQVTFDDDLDMRNLIIDDFLPRGQVFIPGSETFTGSVDYPGAPQTAPGVGYTGSTYVAEALGQTTSGFRINDCPAAGRAPGPSDPFYTDLQTLFGLPIFGGLQNLVWRLCRVDNSDTMSNIIWQVDFQAVLVDNPFLPDDIRVANYANLSGTSSFGRTYSLRDRLNVQYHVPQLVLSKTNTASNPQPTTAAFSYSITMTNSDDFATAYDWTMQDYIPPGIRVNGATCPGFTVTPVGSAPSLGTVECTVDTDVQNGAGGFVQIRPVTGSAHDPERGIAPGDAYTFTFQAEVSPTNPGATADETLRNTASVEFCSQPFPYATYDHDRNPATPRVPALWFDDDNDPGTPPIQADSRRCVGYLNPSTNGEGGGTIAHSDDGGTFTEQDFINYGNLGGSPNSLNAPNDPDDPASSGSEANNSDTSDVRVAPLITDKDDTQPAHVAPQVITTGEANEYATIGEVYTVDLVVTVPARTRLFEAGTPPNRTYVEIIDTIQQDGAVFCDAANAHPLCVDPTILQSGALVTPDTIASPTSPNWWQANNASPEPGSTLRFFVNEIDNSTSNTAYTFTIRFTMLVTGLDDDDTTPVFFAPIAYPFRPNDEVINSFVVRYYNDNTAPPGGNPQEFTTPPVDDQIDINQPYMQADKDITTIERGATTICDSAAACDGSSVTVQGGDVMTYSLLYTNTGESTAFDVTFIDRLPEFVTYNGDMTCTPGGAPSVSSAPDADPRYSVTLTVDNATAGAWDIAPGNTIACTFTVTVSPVVPAGTRLENYTDVDWTSLDGTPPGEPERIYDDTPDDDPDNPDDYPDSPNDDDQIDRIDVLIPEMHKEVTATTLGAPPAKPTDAPVRIGDVVTYQITIPLPIGETRSLIVTDVLDPGLIYYEAGTFTVFAQPSGTDLTASTVETINGTNNGIDDENPDFNVTWAIGDPTCTTTPPQPCIINNVPPGDNDSVVITFQAVVADVAGNVDGVVRDNNVSASFRDGFDNLRTIQEAEDNDPGTPQRLDDEEVVIIESDLLLDKVGVHLEETDTIVDAGDTIRYTVTITNPRPVSAVTNQPTAYDVTWQDVIDARTQYINTPSDTMSCTLNGSPTTAVVTYDDLTKTISVTNNADEALNTWDLRPASTDVLVCNYDVRVLQSLHPNDLIDNTADADWSSQNGEVSGGATDPNEREYDDRDRDGAPPTDDDPFPATSDTDAFQLTVPDMTITKAVAPNSDPNYQSDGEYQPGELVPYQITIALPQGTTQDLRVVDQINTNMRYEAGSASVVSVPVGITLKAGSPTYNDVARTITWDFEDIVHTGTTATADTGAVPPTGSYVITISYYVRVRSSAFNVATGTNLTNTATATFDITGDDIPDASTARSDDAAILTERPSLRLTKTEDRVNLANPSVTNAVDNDDVVTYTVTITNAGPGIAYDTYFEDNLDDDSDFVPGSLSCVRNPGGVALTTQLDDLSDGFDTTDDLATVTSALDNFRAAGNLAEGGAGSWTLQSGESILCTYQVTVSNGRAGDALTNAVIARFDTASGDAPTPPGSSDDAPNVLTVSRTTGALNPSGQTPSDTREDELTYSTTHAVTVNVPPPTIAKTRASADATWQPGEIVPFQIVVTVPEATVQNLRVTDTLPAGLALESPATITNSFSGTLTLDLPIPAAGATGALVWDFANFTVPGSTTRPTDTPSSFETVTISFNARVLNGAADGLLTNTVSAQYDRPGASNQTVNVSPGGSLTATLTIERPRLLVTKTEDDADDIIDAGDLVTYTVTIQNAGPGIAYDAYFIENLDDDTDFDTTFTPTCVGSSGSGLPTTFQFDISPTPNTQTFDGIADSATTDMDVFVIANNLSEDSNGWDLDPNETISCTYRVIVNSAIDVGDPLVQNSVIGRFDTANNDQPNPTYLIEVDEDGYPTTATQNNALESELTYTDDEPTTLSVPEPTLVKNLDSADTEYQPGELVPFEIVVTLPEGEVIDLNVTDTIPAGFKFESTTGITASWTASPPAPTSSPSLGDTGTVTWDFPDFTVTATTTGPTSSYETLTIEFTLRVTGAVADNTVQTNRAAGNYDRPGTSNRPIPQDDAQITTRIPQQSTTKTISRVDIGSGLVAFTGQNVEGGDQIEYTVAITNTDTFATLYDVYFDDDLDSDTDFVVGSLSCATSQGGLDVSTPQIADLAVSATTNIAPGTIGMDTFRVAGSLDEDSNTWDLTPGNNITCTYRVTVNADVTAGSTIDNDVDSLGSSSNGNPPIPTDETEHPDLDNRTTITVSSPGIAKSVTSPTTPAAQPVVTIGQQIEYTINMTLPVGVTNNLTIVDVLEGDGDNALELTYVAGSTVITRGAATLSFEPTESLNGDGERVLTWAFSSPLTYDPSGSAPDNVPTIIIVFRAQVADITQNDDTDVLLNLVSASFNNGSGTVNINESDTTDNDVIVRVPTLETDKTENDDNGVVNPGQEVTFTYTVTNVGTGTGSQIDVRDVIPTGWTYVTGSSELDDPGAGGFASIADPTGTTTLVWDLNQTLQGGEAFILRYRLTAPIPLGTPPFVNNAQAINGVDAIGNPIPPDNSAHDTDNDPDDADSTSLGAAGAIQGRVWHDRPTLGGAFDGGDIDIPLNGVTVQLFRFDSGSGTFIAYAPNPTETTGTAYTYGSETFPADQGYYLFDNLPPGTYEVREVQSTLPGGASAWESVFDADTAPLTGTPADRDLITGIILTAGEFERDQDFGERLAGRIQGYVYIDPNGNGTNDTLPDGVPDGTPDTPIPNITLSLVNADGTPVLNSLGLPITTSTDANGFYEFTDLPDRDGTPATNVYRVIMDTADPDLNPLLAFTPGTDNDVTDLIVNAAGGAPVDEAHFPLRIPPVADLSKSVNDTQVDGGDIVTYTVTLTNTTAAGGAIIYDAYIQDTLDADTSYISASLACTLDPSGPTGPSSIAAQVIGSSPFRIQGGVDEASNVWDLNPGDSITCTYNVVASATIAAGDPTVSNSAQGFYDTLDGEGGASGSTPTRTTNMTVPAPSFTKVRVTPVPGTDDVVEPGDTVAYRIVVTLPDGNTNSLVIRDTLPTGFQFQSAAFTPSWGASPALPSYTEITSGTPATNQIVTWTFSAPVQSSSDNDNLPGGATNTLTLDYTVRVLSSAPANTTPLGNGNDALNTAVVSYTPPDAPNPTDLPQQQAPVDVQHPALVVDKTENDADNRITAGQTVTYTITVSNVGSAQTTAHNIVVTDMLPTGFTYINGSSQLNSVTISDPGVGLFGERIWDLDADPLISPDPTIVGGTSLIITYQATAPNTLSAATYTNFAEARGNDGSGTPIPEDNSSTTGNGRVPADNDPTDDATTTLNAAGAIQGRVWHDRPAFDGIFDAADVDEPLNGVTVNLYRWDGSAWVLQTSLTTNTGYTYGSGAGAETFPAGSYLFNDLEPGRYRVEEVQSSLPGGASAWESVIDRDTLTPFSGTETDRSNIYDIDVAAGELERDQDFTERRAGRIQGYVYIDPNGNGTNTTLPDGAPDGDPDTPLPNITVRLVDPTTGSAILDSTGTPIVTETDANGFYQFTDLPDATYRVIMDIADPQLPAGVTFTPGSNEDVTGLVVNAAGGGAVPEAHFPLRLPLVIDVTKTENDADNTVDAGDTITYTVTITNSAAAGGAIAYDTFFDDDLDDDTDFVPGSLTCSSTQAGLPTSAQIDDLGTGTVEDVAPGTTGLDNFRVANNLSDTNNGWDLNPQESITCQYQVTVSTSLRSGDTTVANSVTGQFDSLNGTNTSSTQILTKSASTTVSGTTPSFVKTRASLPDTVQPGDQVMYSIVITLPEGTTNNLAVTDELPTGFVFVSGSFTAGWGSSPALPALTAEPAADATGTLTWTFGAGVVNPGDNNTANNTLTLNYTVRVLSSAPANTTPTGNGDDALNRAVVSYLRPGDTNPTNLPEQRVPVDVLHPALVVDKTNNDSNGVVENGQVVTFTITVRNVGSSATTAQNVVVTDVMPAGWTYVSNSAQLNGITPINITPSGQILTWNLDTLVDPDPTIVGGGQLVITYQATAPTPTSDTYTNTAAATANDKNNNPIPADNSSRVPADNDPTDDASTTLGGAAAIEGFVWNDLDANGALNGSETALTGVTIQLFLASDLVTPIRTTTTSTTPITYNGVTYPIGSYLFTDLVPGSYVVREVHSGAIQYWESTFDADGGTTEAELNEIAVNNLVAGEIRNDRDFGDRIAGKVQGFVYRDDDGNGSNAIPPGGSDIPIPNVTLTLLDSGGGVVATTTTDSTGFFEFANLPDGTYTVVVDDDDTDIDAAFPPADSALIAFTPGAVDTVGGRVVNVAGGAPIPTAHFPFRVPAPLTIAKTGEDINGTPLAPGETIGWYICVTNTDVLPTDITITDTLQTGRQTLVSGSIRYAVVTSATLCPTTATQAQTLTTGGTSVADTDTINISVSGVASGSRVIVYFETTVKDPAIWTGSGLVPFITTPLLSLLRSDRRRRWLRRAQRVAAVLLLVAALAGILTIASLALSQAEGGDQTTVEESSDRTGEQPPADNTSEKGSDDHQQGGGAAEDQELSEETEVPQATETPIATELPTDESTPEVTLTIAETPEATETAMPDATDEVTPEATIEATPELTETPQSDLPLIEGRIYDDLNANLTQDDSEAGIAGVRVVVYADDGDGIYNAEADTTKIGSATTDDTGSYTVEGIVAGWYWVVVDETTLPENFVDVEALGNRDPQAPVPVEVSEEELGAFAQAVDENGSSAEDQTPALRGADIGYSRDTDGDQTPDGIEGDGDRDGDGTPNYLDPFDPSGIFYIAATGNVVVGVQSALYADSNDNCAYDDGVDLLADTVQANPQTSTNGGYRYDIRPQSVTFPNGVPTDGSSRCFFLEIENTGNTNITYPSTLVTPQSSAFTAAGGAVVSGSLAPVPPIDTEPTGIDGDPETHLFYVIFTIDQNTDDILNNHVALDAADITQIFDEAITNSATASRPGRPPVTDDDKLTLFSVLEFTLVPNNYALLQPGESTTYSHTLTNTGERSDSYTISFPPGTQGWTQTLEIRNSSGTVLGMITPGQTFTTPLLAPDDFLTLHHTITVPPATPHGIIDVTSITATSQTDTNLVRSVTDTTEVEAACVDGIIFNDDDGDGELEATDQNGILDPGEPGIGGVRIFVRNAAGELVATLISAGDNGIGMGRGSYNVGGLPTDPSSAYTFEVDLTTLPAGTPLFVPDGSSVQTINVATGTACSLGSFSLVLFDPAITKTGTPETARIGDEVTFTINVTNNSTAVITGVVVRDPLPAFLTFVSASGIDPANISFDAASNTVIFNIGTMASGASLSLTVVAEVNDNARRPSTITNAASFYYTEGPAQDALARVRVPPPPPSDNDNDDDDDNNPSSPTSQPTQIVSAPTAIATVVAPLVASAGIPGAGISGMVPDEFPTLLPATGEPIQPNLLLPVLAGIGMVTLVFMVLVTLAGLLFRRWIIRNLRRSPTRVIGLVGLLIGLSLGAGFSTSLTLYGMQTLLPVEAVRQTDQTQADAETGEDALSVLTGDAAQVVVAPTATPVTVTMDEWKAQFPVPDVPATRIVIPALNIDTDLTEARINNGLWDIHSFTNEIAHLEGTAFPGTIGNAVLAGHITHRDGFGPFHNLNKLKEGDIILAYSGDGNVEYRYVVTFVQYAEPDDIEYTYPTVLPGKFLTLITCAGWDQATASYTQRVIVRAEELI